MITPTISDVIGGRGGNVNCHPGNMVLLKRVKTLQPIYKSFGNGQDGKKKKSNMTQEVVEWALGRGRFLKPSSEDATLWQEATSQEAYNKVSHLLRDDHSREGMLKKRKKYATSKKAGGFKAAPQPVRAKDRDEALGPFDADQQLQQGQQLAHNNAGLDDVFQEWFFSQYAQEVEHDHELIEALEPFDADQQLADNNAGLDDLFQEWLDKA